MNKRDLLYDELCKEQYNLIKVQMDTEKYKERQINTENVVENFSSPNVSKIPLALGSSVGLFTGTGIGILCGEFNFIFPLSGLAVGFMSPSIVKMVGKIKLSRLDKKIKQAEKNEIKSKMKIHKYQKNLKQLRKES